MREKQILRINCNTYLKKCFYCRKNFITKNFYEKFCSSQCKNRYLFNFNKLRENITKWNY